MKAENHAGPAPVVQISGRAVTKREHWHDPDTSGSVSCRMRGVIHAMSGGDRVFVHLAVHLLFARLFFGSSINRCQQKRGERLVPKKIAQVASGFCPGGVPQISVRARWLKTLSRCLTDRVAGQFIVEWLVANTLLDRPGNSMLFHAGD